VSGGRGLSAGAAVLVVLAVVSVAAVVGLLGRQVMRERERTEHARSGRRGTEVEADALRLKVRELEERLARDGDEARRRAGVSDAEQARLRRELAAAVEVRDGQAAALRAATGERDRAMEDLLAARRDIESVRDDLARATAGRRDAEQRAARLDAEAKDAARRAADAAARARALVPPLLQDLRSPDGTLRVRAHEALCAYAGRDLPFRANGTPEEREADAVALGRALDAIR
jgi:chromosome segregation ATPase